MHFSFNFSSSFTLWPNYSKSSNGMHVWPEGKKLHYCENLHFVNILFMYQIIGQSESPTSFETRCASF